MPNCWGLRAKCQSPTLRQICANAIAPTCQASIIFLCALLGTRYFFGLICTVFGLQWACLFIVFFSLSKAEYFVISVSTKLKNLIWRDLEAKLKFRANTPKHQPFGFAPMTLKLESLPSTSGTTTTTVFLVIFIN